MEWGEKTIDGLDGNGLLKTDKMAAGAFERARNYGWEALLTRFGVRLQEVPARKGSQNCTVKFTFSWEISGGLLATCESSWHSSWHPCNRRRLRESFEATQARRYGIHDCHRWCRCGRETREDVALESVFWFLVQSVPPTARGTSHKWH